MARLVLALIRLAAGQAARRMAISLGLLAVAALFLLIFALALAAALAIWLAQRFDPLTAALIIAGGALVLALLCLLLARRKPRDSLLSHPLMAELEAALGDKTSTLATWAPLLGVAVLGFLLGSGRRR